MKTIENAPRLKIEDTLYGVGVAPPARVTLEKRIVWNLLKHLAAAGWVATREADEPERFSSVIDAMEMIFNLDEARIIFKKEEASKAHAVVLVLGNELDIVSDWSYTDADPDGFNAAMEAFNAVAL